MTKVAQQAANDPVGMPQAPKPLSLILFWSCENSLFQLLALWGNKNWPPQYEGEKVRTISEQKGLNLLQMTQFECPRPSNPSASPHSRVDKT